MQCGDCCRTIFSTLTLTQEELNISPLKLDVIKINKNRFQVKVKGNICLFLNDNICTVHDIRPCQCRLYHCGRRSINDKKCESILELKQLMETDHEYKQYKEQTELEAVTWGNQHGWNWKKWKKQ